MTTRADAALMRSYARLPAVERAVIELVDLEGLSPKEAALALGVSQVAFLQRLSRAWNLAACYAHSGNLANGG